MGDLDDLAGAARRPMRRRVTSRQRDSVAGWFIAGVGVLVLLTGVVLWKMDRDAKREEAERIERMIREDLYKARMDAARWGVPQDDR